MLSRKLLAKKIFRLFAAEDKRKPGRKPPWQLSRLGQIAIGSPEEGGAHGNGIVAIGVVLAVIIINALGGGGYVLGLQIDPLRQLVAGEADP